VVASNGNRSGPKASWAHLEVIEIEFADLRSAAPGGCAAPSAQPMHPVMLLIRWVGEELLEGDDEVFGVAQPASMKASGRREHDPEMVLTRRQSHASDPVEVLHVLDY
jgi:hypothetical protein